MTRQKHLTLVGLIVLLTSFFNLVVCALFSELFIYITSLVIAPIYTLTLLVLPIVWGTWESAVTNAIFFIVTSLTIGPAACAMVNPLNIQALLKVFALSVICTGAFLALSPLNLRTETLVTVSLLLLVATEVLRSFEKDYVFVIVEVFLLMFISVVSAIVWSRIQHKCTPKGDSLDMRAVMIDVRMMYRVVVLPLYIFAIVF